jgi:hypothetical protein
MTEDILAYFHYLEKNKCRLMLCVSANPPYRLLNDWTSLYETWCVYHGTWAHLNGVLHKSLPSVCVSVCISLPSLQGKGSVKCIPSFIVRQQLGKHIPWQRGIVRGIGFYTVHESKGSRRLVLERTFFFPYILNSSTQISHYLKFINHSHSVIWSYTINVVEKPSLNKPELGSNICTSVYFIPQTT